jgi:hypothetical protein
MQRDVGPESTRTFVWHKASTCSAHRLTENATMSDQGEPRPRSGESEMSTQTAPGEPASADFIGARACLVGRIVGQLRSQGHYVGHIDAHTGQALIDLRWAAQMAGREIGRHTRTYVSAPGRRVPGMVTVIVAPVEEWSDVPGANRAKSAIEELLTVHSAILTSTAAARCSASPWG